MANAKGLSLQGGQRPTWQSRSSRLHRGKVTGEIATAFPRLPRRFAPRNDTSGRRSNGNGAAHRIGGTTAASRTGGACPSRRRTGVRDRLSLKWQTPKVCHCKEAKGRRGNLAVPGCIVGKLPAKSQLPSRDCHVASLLAMTRQGSAAMGTVRHTESAVLLPLRGRAGHAPPLQGQCGFNGGRCESAMPSRDCHGPFGASQ